MGAGAAAGATNSPMVDDYGRVIGNWGGKDETGNPAYVLPPDAAHAPPIAPYSKDELDRRLQAQKDVRDQALQGQPGAFHPDDLREPTEPPPAKSFWHQIFGATSTGIVPVSFTKDSSSSSMFEEAVARGTYDGFMRVLEAREGDAGNGGGGGIVNASYETPGAGEDVGGNTVRRPENLRYNRQHKAILTHRKGADGGGPPTPLGHTGSKFAGKAPAIMRGLMTRYGLTREQAAGVLGNLGHESAGFTAYHEGGQLPGKGGVGWAQWTGSRRRAFEAWTKAHGLDPTSDEASWRYLTEGDPETAGAITAVKRTHDAHSAAVAFEGAFERAGVKAYGSRFKFADQALRLGPAPEGGTAYADESRHGMARSAEHPLLPRRPAPVAPHTDDIQAMNVAPAIDHSSIREALHHVRELKREMASLGSASIDVKHRGFGSRGAHSPGAVRTALNGNFTSDGRWA